jgi:hypothetical protein
MTVDEHRLRKLEEEAIDRDQEAEKQLEQNKQLTASMQNVEHDWEVAHTENKSLREILGDFEVDLENTKEENAKLAGHTNHKQKVKYHLKVKEENTQLKQQVSELRQRVSQYESGKRGSSLLEALASFGGGAGGPGELSVCGQSVCSTRGQEPRTPNPKGPPRTPRRPNSAGPQSARGRGSMEADLACPSCALQQRATERTIVDFQHVVTLIERAVFAGGVGASTSDPSSVLDRLREAVATGACPSGSNLAPQTPKPARTVWSTPAAEKDGVKSEAPTC